jgi:hypothetical protein
MGNDIYGKSGIPVGFHDGNLIYDLFGRAVGQLRGSKVYCMAGHYVGQLQNGIILNKNRSRGSIGANRVGGKWPHGKGIAKGARNQLSRQPSRALR